MVGVEAFLRQLDAQIAAMEPADRDAAAVYIAGLLRIWGKYPKKITAGATLKFISLFGIAHGTDGIERFKEKVRKRAKEIGPHVGAAFQAL